MGASRKLQAEIDRVLKKVQEGIDLFDSIWNKVYNTDFVNLKDKYEAELKKEIKKLKRHREQIKTWIQSSEIKDKKSLLDARKQIEREMERFKIFEKEIKTKAFSNEGLEQQPKTDPKEKAKEETRDWINNLVGELKSQVDNFEAEREGLTVKKGKKNRPPRLTHLETSITRHKAHIKKLELILRLLHNNQLSPEQVNDVKDFLEDYVERNQDDFDEFSEVDELYESLPLDKLEAHEDLVAIGQPSLVKGTAVLKTPVYLSSSRTLAAVTPLQRASPFNGVQSTHSKSSLISNSCVKNPVGSRTNFIPVKVSSQLPGSPASVPVCARGIIESGGAYMSYSSLNVTTVTTEDDSVNLPGQLSSSTVTEDGVVEGVGMLNITGQSDNLPLNSWSAVCGRGLGRGAIPLASDSVDRTGSADSSYVGCPPAAPGFQNKNEMASVTPQQSTTALGQLKGLTAMDSNSNGVPCTTSKSSLVSNSSFTNTVGSSTNFVPVNVSSQLPGTPASIPVCARGTIESDGANMSSSSLNVTTVTTTEDDSLNLPGRWASSTVTENGVAGDIEMLNTTGQSDNPPLNSGTVVVSHGLGLGAIPLASDYRNSNVLGADEKLLSSGMLQSTPTYSLNNSVPQSTNSVDRIGSADSSYVGYPVSAGGSFTSFMAPGMQQQKPGFQNLNKMGQFGGRTEIAPDQREKFLQRFQQVQQQGSSDLLGMQTPGGSNSIEVTRQQQKPLQSSAPPFEVGLGPGLNVHTLACFEQPCISIPPQAAQYRYPSNYPKDPVSPAHRTGTSTGVDFQSSRQMGSSSSQPSTSSTGGCPDRLDLQYMNKMLESALDKRPQPMDSERRVGVIPQSYPQVQPPILNDPAFWSRISNRDGGCDTLFCAFYFQQHSFPQLMAAKALMNKGWILHKGLNTWFKRHGEPVAITSEYERGPYIFFDYRNWCTKMEQDFTFEYRHVANL